MVNNNTNLMKGTAAKNTQTTPVKGAVNIENLLAKREQISNKAVQAAIAKLEEQKAKEQEELILNHLSTIQAITANAVESLREARRKEAKAKAYLQAVAEAEQQFYTDANMETYEASLHKARTDYHKG